MKTKRFIFYAAATVVSFLLLLIIIKPTGPVTTRELAALTNTMQKFTADPIIRIRCADAETTMLVTTTNYQVYQFERTSFGWKYIPSGAF